MQVIAYPNLDLLADGAAAAITAAVKSSPGPRVLVGLAGGSTPRVVYERLRWQPIEWERVDLWLSDERWVAPDHEDSNGRMAHETLATHVSARFVRPRWSEFLTAADSAAFYEAELRRMTPDGASDLILLGMGTDGHTASLFPGTDAMTETTRWFTHNRVPQLDTWRMTATAPVLNRARTVIVLVAGESKAEVLASVLEGPDDTYPIQLLRQSEGEVMWLIDEAAASKLVTAPTRRP